MVSTIKPHNITRVDDVGHQEREATLSDPQDDVWRGKIEQHSPGLGGIGGRYESHPEGRFCIVSELQIEYICSW